MIKRIIAIAVLADAMLVAAVNAITPAMAAKDSCNSEGVQLICALIQTNHQERKGAPMIPRAGN